MTTKENTILILGNVYDIIIEKGDIASQTKISEVTKLDDSEIINALNYLKKTKMINGDTMLSGEYIDINITDIGIETRENKEKFKKIFGIEVGIPGIISAYWGAEEK